uniref:uncharacterized protein LOC117602898 n=1 Tax=Osmia lignaria TaxID=473952 RepID=UPI0014781D0F|nr:uncharacterized protein LOC117602898 [Osmia lignaria]
MLTILTTEILYFIPGYPDDGFLHDFRLDEFSSRLPSSPTRQPPTWCCPSSYLTVGRRVYLRTVSRMFYGSSGAQSCRRTNGPNRHGLPVVYVVDKHSDHGYDYTHE